MPKQVVFEPGQNYLTVDHNNLLKGDVILTANQNSIKSWTIRKITKSDFSHAIMCTDPPWCVESASRGVLRFVISRLLVTSMHNMRILRLNRRSARAGIAEEAARFADDQVTREYAKKDVLAYPFRSIPQIEKGRFFCSQLVAESFSQANLELLPGKSPLKISPGDLARSHEFVDVTSRCLRQATDSEKLNCTGFLDGDEIFTPHAEEVLLKQRIMKQLTPILKKSGVKAETYDDLLQQLVEGWERGDWWVSQIDEALTKAILNSGQVSLSRRYFPPHHDYYFLDVYLARLLHGVSLDKNDIPTLKNYYEGALQIRDQSIKETEALAVASRQMYVLTGLESVRLNGALLEDIQSVRIRQGTILKQCLAILSSKLAQLSRESTSDAD